MENITTPNGSEVIVNASNGEVTVNQIIEDEETANISCARVNFNEPTSLVSYCDEIKDCVGQLLIDTANMSVNQQQAFITDEDLKLITSFDESLLQSKKEAERKEGLIEHFTKLIRLGLGSDSAKKEEEMKTYRGRYQEYCNKIRQVCDNVDVLKENAIQDIQLRSDIAHQMTPYVKKLSIMIELGKQDKAAYDEETQKIASTDDSDDTKRIVQYREGLSTFFASKLMKLEQVLVAYKEQLQSYALQQNTDMIVVDAATSYVKDQAPILNAQGSTQVFNMMQEDRIHQLSLLSEASNLAIKNNAKNLEQNTIAAKDLMLNGGIQTDALAEVQTRLQNGIKIIQQGKKELKDKIKKDQDTLAKVNALLEQNENELLSIIKTTSTAMAEIDSATTRTHTPLLSSNGRKI